MEARGPGEAVTNQPRLIEDANARRNTAKVFGWDDFKDQS
jgi:hypothetical protein